MRLGGGGTEIKRPVLSSVSFQSSERQGMQSGNREAAGGGLQSRHSRQIVLEELGLGRWMQVNSEEMRVVISGRHRESGEMSVSEGAAGGGCCLLTGLWGLEPEEHAGNYRVLGHT